ncbi:MULTISPECIES: hypothetical protein [Fischerella]|nr:MULTISPECIES: hypothetical protein [Fischerella]
MYRREEHRVSIHQPTTINNQQPTTNQLITKILLQKLLRVCWD